MQCKFYIPYSDYDAMTGFDAGIEMSEEEYTNYLNNYYQQNKLSMSEIMGGGRGMSPQANMQYEETVKKNILAHTKYYEVSANLLDMNGKEQKIDDLIKYYQKNEMFINRVIFNDSISNSDAYSEFRTWAIDSKRILDSNRLDENTKLLSLTPVDFKVSFGKDSNALLNSCKMLEMYTPNSFAILIKQIVFVKNL